MFKISSVSVVMCLVATVLAHGADFPLGDEGRKDALSRELMVLERDWQKTNNPSYFSKSRGLIPYVRQGLVKADPKYHTFMLDLTSGLLVKSRDGTEFDMNAEGAVRHCQNEAVDELASVDPAVIAKLQDWPDFRARYARLMMFQRGKWISLRDPSKAGPIMLDSTVHFGPRDRAADALRQKRNQQAQMQYDIKRFLSETGPKIENFMVRAFSLEPYDFRTLNEMLLMGGYAAEKRRELVTKAAGNTERLPEILRIQLVEPAAQSSKDENANKPSGGDVQ